MSKPRSGGGITMNKNVTGRVTTGTKRIEAISPGGVTRQATEPARQGNDVAINSKIGPGADRTVHATGSQGHHGQSAEPKKG